MMLGALALLAGVGFVCLVLLLVLVWYEDNPDE